MKSPVFSSKPRSVGDILGGFTKLVNELKTAVSANEKAKADAEVAIAKQAAIMANADGEITRANNAIEKINAIIGA